MNQEQFDVLIAARDREEKKPVRVFAGEHMFQGVVLEASERSVTLLLTAPPARAYIDTAAISAVSVEVEPRGWLEQSEGRRA
jgi:hypothetical protein